MFTHGVAEPLHDECAMGCCAWMNKARVFYFAIRLHKLEFAMDCNSEGVSGAVLYQAALGAICELRFVFQTHLILN